MRRPRLNLAHLPTPLCHFDALDRLVGCELWLKRDDFTHGPAAGNKIRKLEYLLADAKRNGSDCVITCGGEQSNHARATAVCARQLGMQPVLFLRTASPEVVPPSIGNLFVNRLLAAQLHFIDVSAYARRDQLMANEATRLAELGSRPYVIPEGGSNGLGALGYVTAMEELHRQLELGLAGSVRHFDSVVVACGSGGTTAGVALGARLTGVAGRVDSIAVCESRAYFEAVVQRIVVEARGLDPRLSSTVPVFVHDEFKGPAYAVSTAEQIEFITEAARVSGVVLDPVYTGKALFGLSRLTEKPGRALFVHTGGLLGALAQSASFA